MSVLDNFQQFGIYGLIETIIKENLDDNSNPRVKAYNLLKTGYRIAKKSSSQDLQYLPKIAFGLSRHESVYRMAGLLYAELKETEKAIECLIYLNFYYQENDQSPHDQYELMKSKIKEQLGSNEDIEEKIIHFKEMYEQLSKIAAIKEYPEIMNITDRKEQSTYFKRLYRRYGIDIVITAIDTDVRLSDREKAIITIRAGRTIGAIASEGVAVESLFADKALQLNESDTVVKNAYQAYLRAGDINTIAKLKQKYSYL